MTDADDLRAFFRRVEDEGKAAGRRASKEALREAIDLASAEIDRIFVFKGAKKSPDQRLAWPRLGAGVPENEVPKCVMVATHWLAAAYLVGYRIGPPDRFPHVRDTVACLFWLLDPVIDADASARNTPQTH